MKSPGVALSSRASSRSRSACSTASRGSPASSAALMRAFSSDCSSAVAPMWICSARLRISRISFSFSFATLVILDYALRKD